MIVFMGCGITSRGQGLGTVFGTAVKVHCTVASCTVQLPLDVCYSSGSRICTLTNGNLVLFWFHVLVAVNPRYWLTCSDCSCTVNS